MFCFKCGTQLLDGDQFCANCGAAQQIPQQTPPSLEQTYKQTEPIEPTTGPAYGTGGPAPWQAGQTYYPPMQEQAHQQQTGQTYYPPMQEQTHQQQQNEITQQTTAPDNQTYAQKRRAAGTGVAANKKSGLWWKIAVPIAAVAIVAVAVYYFFILRSPSDRVEAALANMSSEMTRRIDSTPLKAYGMLVETMKDGTVTVNYDYTDYSGEKGRVSVSFASVLEELEFAIIGDVSADGQNIDVEAYINKERIAVGASLLGDKYYGFRYSTFGDDIQEFGSVIGLNRATMDQLTSLVEVIETVFNQEPSEVYADILTNFNEKCEQTSENVEIDSGGETVKATKIEISVTKDAIVGLLNDLYDSFESDTNAKALLNAISGIADTYGMDYENMLLREFRDMMREIEDNYSDTSTITISLFIGNSGRLIRSEINTNIRMDGERIRFSGTFDFGSSDTDRWVFRLNNGSETIRIVWDYKERSSSLENTITISIGPDTITLSSTLSPSRGDFTLSYEYDYGSGWSDEGEIAGVFLEENGGFRLILDDIAGLGFYENHRIEIIAKPGANIKQIDYLPLNEWGQTLLADLEDLFLIGLPWN